MSPIASWVHLDGVLLVVLAWLAIGVAGVLALRRFRFVAIVLFPLGAVCSLVLLAVGLSAAFSGTEVAVLPIGLPQLPFHLRLDSLSAFFLIVTLSSIGLPLTNGFVGEFLILNGTYLAGFGWGRAAAC